MAAGPEQVLSIRDEASGLEAFLVIDSTALGPAVGGVRTKRYPNRDAALADAAALARAMTLKCSIAGLDAGGGKCVVIDQPGLDRPAAFAELGARVEGLGGQFRTAGDLGTGPADLDAMASTCRYVHRDSARIGGAVARGVAVCAAGAMEVGDIGSLDGASAIVQGAGAMGAGVARELAARGAKLRVADVDITRAEELAREIGADVIDSDRALTEVAELVSPCAIGGVVTADLVPALRCRVVCGAANNILAEPEVAASLLDHGVLFVPDFLSSAGGVIDGIARSVMGVSDPAPMVERLGAITRAILEESTAEKCSPVAVAERRAWTRVREAATVTGET